MPRLLPILAALAVLAGCGLPSLPGLPGLPGGGPAPAGGSGSGPAAGLWPDVPPLPGASPVDVELPLPVKMLVKGFMNAAQASDNNGQEAKDWEFKVYQAAGSNTDVGGFYGQQLPATGWTQGDDACGGSSPVPSALPGGALCLFTKRGADGFTENLAIVLMPGAGDGGADQVAYVRFAGKG